MTTLTANQTLLLQRIADAGAAGLTPTAVAADENNVRRANNQRTYTKLMDMGMIAPRNGKDFLSQAGRQALGLADVRYVLARIGASDNYLGFGATVIEARGNYKIIEIPTQHAEWMVQRLMSGLEAGCNEIFDSQAACQAVADDRNERDQRYNRPAPTPAPAAAPASTATRSRPRVTANLNGVAGLWRETKKVQMYIASQAGMDASQGEYTLKCKEHGTLNSFELYNTALTQMGQVREWCPGCHK